jgi:hypothetical protein
MKVTGWLVGLGLLAANVDFAVAHHSYAAFDLNKTVKVAGVVKEWRWTNPHSFVVLITEGADGKPVEAVLEANGPGYLARRGWKRDSLKVGDKITATIHPLRAGSPGGDLVSATLPNGQVLSAEITGPQSVQAGAAPATEQKAK